MLYLIQSQIIQQLVFLTFPFPKENHPGVLYPAVISSFSNSLAFQFVL